MSLALKLNRHLPPRDQKTSEKNIRYAELDIPQALAKYRPQLSSLSAASHPEQGQVNWVNRQRAIASSKDPPYVPYLIPNLTEAPRLPPKRTTQLLALAGLLIRNKPVEPPLHKSSTSKAFLYTKSGSCSQLTFAMLLTSSVA